MCDTISSMFSRLTTRLPLLGIVFLFLAGNAFAAQEQRIATAFAIAYGEEGIFVFESVSKTIYQLGMDESKTGWFREIYNGQEDDIYFLPLITFNDSGGFIVFHTGFSEFVAIAIDPSTGEREILNNGRPVMRQVETLLAVDGDNLAIYSPGFEFPEIQRTVRIESSQGEFSIPAPDGEFHTPVAAKSPDAEWYAIWTRKQEDTEEEGWAGFAMKGYNPPGEFLVMHTSDGEEISQYEIINPAFSETRAESLEGVVIDDDGKLILLDDKGYISIFDGQERKQHFFAGISTSRSVKNSIARGPDDGILVSDGVSRTINLYGPDGQKRYSWRIPAKEKETNPSALSISILFDIVVIVLIIIVAWSIVSRKKRMKRYNRGAG